MEFFNVAKATQKSGKQDAVVWFTAKTEARANLMLDVALEDAGIETGRGKDYAKPIRTDFPVVDDLPEEGEIDFTWCDRYELAEDQRTWNVKLKADNAAQEENHQVDDNVVDGETGHADESQQAEQPQLITVATLSLRQRILAQFISDEYAYHIDAEQKKIIQGLELDVDNSYVQNLLLAAENVEFFKNAAEIDISRVVAALKTVFPVEGKRTELSLVMRFIRIWFNTDYTDRGILAREWAAGNRVSNVQRTDSGTNADGGYVTDRGEGAHHTLDTLDLEIACALLPMDFNHFEIPGSILRRAKEIVTKKEEPWKSWSSILRNQPGVLGVNRTAIFNLVRIAPENIHLTPVAHLEFVNQTMTAEFNSAVELLPLSEAAPAATEMSSAPESVEPSRKSFCTHEENLQRVREEGARRRAEEAAAQPQKVEQELVKNVGNGIFDVTALLQNSATHGTKKATETTSDVQVQETNSDEKQAGDALHTGKSSVETGEKSHTSQQADVNQNTDSVAQNCDSVNQTEPVSAQTEPETQSDEPAVVYPAYFEPGRYEGLPNEVYHAANGISSTQVKDARVSLMFYHGRHVTKTIRRESSEALTFGSLAHTLALEPEKLHEEFAVFPGIPAEAFTTTDSMKAFIREFNADKPKAEQLKLTGKKEELQAAIRAVSPEAIFADEFEQQWRDSVDGKTILSREQLTLATAIQQALLNHESAGKLLRHPSRSVETSYFGMDDETGLEVRVRPDLEVQINGVRIGVDLKTISMGRVKQDGLRAKLHREIIDRDYHLSAGMYCSVADFDQFFWIFVNKDEGYHWVAVIEASEDLLDLGLLEYQRTMRALANAYDTDCWSAPITEDYTDELNDFDLRRLEALRLA
ncbi:PD-(D/E)XK nuclease-like domain-containing protein [Citrobacter braakii]|uniref:RecE family exodeoxyribonuclease n=1 Tax=Citrobacter braakii TaxID=57706 RepID=UPI00243341D6|nr:RecE family exodeoxyribonuclease [Citrobacter braakii]WFX69364.1 PD-(D/E)XK nuclease-like domain-containing protein [Citrobacter braakii]